MYKTIYLRKGKEESLLRYHPWIFSGAIQRMDDGLEEGEVVRVLTSSGDYIATGHYQQGSITVRVLTFSDVEIDDQFWYSRLSSALRMRQAIGIADSADNNTYRLVHGECDLLPGLIIDVYGQTAVMQAHSIGMHLNRKAIARQLMEVMGDRLQHVYYKSETTLSFMDPENGFLIGGSKDNVAVENGLKFCVEWLKGQKTGFFVDQRENRSLLERYAKGRRVLNMFCYTGGFSVYAMRGGASLVHSVDSSAKAIELTRQNVEMNFPNDPRHEAFCDDAFKFLERVALGGSRGGFLQPYHSRPAGICQAPWGPAQCVEGLHPTEPKGVREDREGRYSLYFLLLTSSDERPFPQCRVHGCCPGSPQGTHPASAAPAS